MNTIIELKDITRYFAHSRALNNVNLSIYEGECLGIVGHNGAGKSTLVNILTGTFHQSSGEYRIDGELHGPEFTVSHANKKGIRVVFQELSLCPNLSVAENMRVFHPGYKGVNWRKRASKAIMATMDTIFPGHGIQPNDVIETLSLGQRQIVEIAKAFTSVEEDLRLLILDEPTSALDHHTSRQLIDYIVGLRGSKMSIILITHILDEIIACTNRIMVMKDGENAGILNTPDANKQKVIELMGQAKVAEEAAKADRKSAGTSDEKFAGAPLVIEPRKEDGGQKIRLRQGEVIGLTGLAGHGQTSLLIDLFDWKGNRDYRIKGPTTFIPGDRPNDGLFSQWSITENMTVQSYEKVKGAVLIDPKKEKGVAERWKGIIDIRAASLNMSILSLSGGNQQKVIFARCLESSAPIVLMDDPTRGVDVGTKEDIYKLILAEKKKGRSFVWYTTEMSELKYCDTLYVFKAGTIRARLDGETMTEDEILRQSF